MPRLVSASHLAILAISLPSWEVSSREYLQIQIFIFLLPYCHKFFEMPLFKGGIDGGRLVVDGNFNTPKVIPNTLRVFPNKRYLFSNNSLLSNKILQKIRQENHRHVMKSLPEVDIRN